MVNYTHYRLVYEHTVISLSLKFSVHMYTAVIFSVQQSKTVLYKSFLFVTVKLHALKHNGKNILSDYTVKNFSVL